jgi:hypothetical protein
MNPATDEYRRPAGDAADAQWREMPLTKLPNCLPGMSHLDCGRRPRRPGQAGRYRQAVHTVLRRGAGVAPGDAPAGQLGVQRLALQSAPHTATRICGRHGGLGRGTSGMVASGPVWRGLYSACCQRWVRCSSGWSW